MRRAFILAGGQGTRLRPHTLVLPKPLIPLGRESIIERVLRGLADAGLIEVTISLGYLGHLVEAVVGDGGRYGIRVTYTREDQPMGTAGALNLLPHELAVDDSVLVINGDTLTTLDFRDLLDWFEGGDADAAMVCVEREVKIDYGVVVANPQHQLIEIREKPTTEHLLSTGINVLRGRSLRQLPSGHVNMPDFLMGLVAEGGTVECFVFDGLWMDLGRVDDLNVANELVERGEL